MSLRFFFSVVASLGPLLSPICLAGEPIDIGARRQLFVDNHLIDSMNGVQQVLHRPVRREIAIKSEYPWEKHGVWYMVTFSDGDKFRAWYRVNPWAVGKAPRRPQTMTAYAESTDGIHWHKPKLGIIEFEGSKENNLVWVGPGENMAPFKDGNPEAPLAERYKAIVRSSDARYAFGLVSRDGLSWRLLRQEPILTRGPFDSHNIAFWDQRSRQYVAYLRGARSDGNLGQGMSRSDAFYRIYKGLRWVRRSTSKDFRDWTTPVPIQTGDGPAEEFYTNATIRYQRAPDYLFMLPSRFASGREPKPGWKLGKGVNDIVFLSSRDGIHFDRSFAEAFVRPGLDQGNWHERSLYMERGILHTSPTELSMYAMENSRLPSAHIRRLTIRPDGFISISAGYDGGELITQSLKFSGEELRLNYSTSAVGAIRVRFPFSGRRGRYSLRHL